jgi:hypothetical protein
MAMFQQRFESDVVKLLKGSTKGDLITPSVFSLYLLRFRRVALGWVSERALFPDAGREVKFARPRG